MNISKAKPDDAEALVNLFNQLEDETDFMLFEPGERNITVERRQKDWNRGKLHHQALCLLPASAEK